MHSDWSTIKNETVVITSINELTEKVQTIETNDSISYSYTHQQ